VKRAGSIDFNDAATSRSGRFSRCFDARYAAVRGRKEARPTTRRSPGRSPRPGRAARAWP
jgi:hypothetical protein